jgi:hypothetical protein
MLEALSAKLRVLQATSASPAAARFIRNGVAAARP